MNQYKLITILILVFIIFTNCTLGDDPESKRTEPTYQSKMVWIPGGTFTMGSLNTEPGYMSMESPRHDVVVNGFYMGRHQVTQTEFEEVMGFNPSINKGNGNLPVDYVNWYYAVKFCNELSMKEKLNPCYTIVINREDPNNTAFIIDPYPPYNKTKLDQFMWTITWNKAANGYRLPTEAEWEYACRAGTTTYYNTGNSITASQANFNSGNTVRVESYKPNAYGLYDMHGNVWEWCWDWCWDYPSENVINPTGSLSGSTRVLRGGSWRSTAERSRSAARYNSYGDRNSYEIGFRIVLQQEKK